MRERTRLSLALIVSILLVSTGIAMAEPDDWDDSTSKFTQAFNNKFFSFLRNFFGSSGSLSGAPVAGCAAPPVNMVAWWDADNVSGVVVGDLQGTNIGTLLNGATTATGQVGSAFSFDGVDDSVAVPDNPSFDFTDFTADAWIKTSNAGSGRRRIVSQQPTPGEFWAMSLQNNQLELCSAPNGGVPDLAGFCLTHTGQSLNDNQWHHVAVTRQGGVQFTWYIDGVAVQTAPSTHAGAIAFTTNVYIGRVNPSFGSETFAGLIDEVEIFNRALSGPEIQAIYSAGVAGKCKTPTVCGDGFVEGNEQCDDGDAVAGDGCSATCSVEPGFECVGLQPSVCTPLVCIAPPANMVGWWDADDVSGVTVVDIQLGNNGTLINGGTTATGLVGSAFSFDGVDDGVQVFDSPSFDFTDFTADAWVKTANAGAGRRRIVSHQPTAGEFWAMSLQNNQLELCSAPNGGVPDLAGFCSTYTGQSLNDNQWHHVAVTRQAGVQFAWYVDGVQVQTAGSTHAGAFTFATDVYIGRVTPLFGTEAFNGLIDEVELFNRALSLPEIQAIYNANNAGKCKPGCGNNVTSGSEVCDGPDLSGQTCESQGFTSGTLGCALTCDAFDTAACVSVCGNSLVETGEVCDSANLNGQTCESQGFASGTLACSGSCDAFDTNACVPAVCGNDVQEASEVCDGTDLVGQTCVSQGFAGGDLACSVGCDDFDNSTCIAPGCGNGIQEAGEQCDNGNVIDGDGCSSTCQIEPSFFSFGGFGTGNGQFFGVRGLDAGSIFVTDQVNGRVQRFDDAGNFISVFAAGLNNPFDVAFDNTPGLEAVWVADTSNNFLRKFFITGSPGGVFGGTGSGNGQFSFLAALALDSAGNVYVADQNNNRVQKFDKQGNFLAVIVTAAQLSAAPAGVAIDSQGNIYVAEAGTEFGGSNTVHKFDSTGNSLTVFGGLGSSDGQFLFSGGAGLAIDSQDNLYVAEGGNDRVSKFDSNDNFVGWAGKCTSGVNCDVANQRNVLFTCTAATCGGLGSGTLPGQFDSPFGVGVDDSGTVYVGEGGNHRVQVLGQPDSDGDGVAEGVDLCPNTPIGAAIDANGCSDLQVDSNGDGVCNVGAPSAGPSGCVAPGCGNGFVEAGELCDDGNLAPGDGCDATCDVELGFSCGGQPSVCTPTITCGDVVTENTVLGGNIAGCGAVGLTIGADDITLDCAGFSIGGTGAAGSVGVDLGGFDRVTVQNCDINGFETGVLVSIPSNDNVIQDNTLTGTSPVVGIGVTQGGLVVGNNTLTNNVVSNYLSGFQLYSKQNTFDSNNVSEVTIAFQSIAGFLQPGNNLFVNNLVRGTTSAIGFDGMLNDTLIGNTVLGGRGAGVENSKVINNSFIDSNSWGIRASSNNLIEGNTIVNASPQGLLVFGNTNNVISKNNFTSNPKAAILVNPTSSSNKIVNNTFTDNIDAGATFEGAITIDTSPDNLIADNVITGSERQGLLLISSPSTKVFHNNFLANDLDVKSTDGLFSATPVPIELSFNGDGNYWGRTCGDNTGFAAGLDTNDPSVSDGLPFGAQDDWELGALPCTVTPVNSCQTIATPGKYRLTADVTASTTCINITADDVDLNCNGHTITFDTNGVSTINTGQSILFAPFENMSVGVVVFNRDDVSISNCNIIDGSATGDVGDGIRLVATTNSTVANNNINSTGTIGNAGIRLTSHVLYPGPTTGTLIADNTIHTVATDFTDPDNDIGISLQGSHLGTVLDTVVRGNTIRASGTGNQHRGVRVIGSNNTVKENDIALAGNSTQYQGVYVLTGSGNLVANNTVLINETAVNHFGMRLLSTNGNQIENNDITVGISGFGGAHSGIQLITSGNNLVRGNTIYVEGVNTDLGIFFAAAFDNTVANNTITVNGSSGVNHAINLQQVSTGNTISGNTLSTHGGGQAHFAVVVRGGSTDNMFSENDVKTEGPSNRNVGFSMSEGSHNNTVHNNSINTSGGSNNHDGVKVLSAHGNRITFNTMISTSGSTADDSDGVDVSRGNNTFIANNTMISVEGRGIFLDDSFSVTAADNTVQNAVREGILVQGGSPTIFHNNILNTGGFKVSSTIPLELSFNNEGNFWGRVCPGSNGFISGVDSDNPNVVDSWGFGLQDEWAGGGVPCASTTPVCGDDILQTIEQCDDGNLVDGDGCSSTCQTVCGDGVIVGNEECDDNNIVNGDGCSSVCSVETDFACVGEPSVCTTCVSAPANLVSWWDGDNVTGTTALDIQDGNDAVLVNGVGTTPGFVGDGFLLDGTNDYIDTPSINIGNQFSIDFWVFPTKVGAFQHLVSNHWTSPNYGALYLNNGRLEFWQNSGGRIFTAAGSIPQTTWSHVTLTYDGSVSRLYINGALAGTSAAHTMTFNNALRVGASNPFESSFFGGVIDELELFSRELSQPEIQGIVDAGPAGKCKGVQDLDGDGVFGVSDVCPGTAGGEVVDATGCSCNDPGHVTCDDGLTCTVDSCNVLTALCENPAGNVGVECRGSIGVCDVAESCDGLNAACPVDGFEPITTQCRGSAGACDTVEFCTGTSAACPADSFEPTATLCRAGSGDICDPDEVCTGISAGCPVDIVQPGTTQCRGSAGVCDVAESCTGIAGQACPVDVFEPGTTECRADTGVCDVAEQCDGLTANCPVDAFEPLSTVCPVTPPNAQNHCDGVGACVCNPTGTSEAICNGFDDDCDVLVDEDFVNAPTTCGVGVCSAAGALSCTAGVESDSCTPGAPTEPVKELSCNDGFDNDCDGFIDNKDRDCPGTLVIFNQFEGAEEFDLLGISVSNAGNILKRFDDDDDDDDDDRGRQRVSVMIGAPGVDVGGLFDVGRAFVFPGLGQKEIHKFDGENSFDNLGQSASGVSASVGDINNDGVDDLVVGAPFADPSGTSSGSVLVFSGKNGKQLFELTGLATGDILGWSVSGAGDVNNDGTPDIIAGATGADVSGLSGAGKAFVFSGLDGSVLYELVSDLPAEFESFGHSVSSAGDVNGDNFADVIVGVPSADVPNPDPEAPPIFAIFTNAGKAFVFSGFDGSLLYRLDGSSFGDSLGHSVSSAGDVNGDTVPDFIIGAKGADVGGFFGAGKAFVISGADGSTVLYELVSDSPAGGDSFGHSVSSAGDVDGDGTPDIIVGAPFADPAGMGNAGRVFVFSGFDGSLLFSSDDLPPTFGRQSGERLGESVSKAGDVNGDGRSDVIIGAVGFNNFAGRALILGLVVGTDVATCQDIDDEGDYFLTADVAVDSATCFDVDDDDIVLDCLDHIVAMSGTGTIGVKILGVDRTRIRNCRFIETGSDDLLGILVGTATDTKIENVEITLPSAPDSLAILATDVQDIVIDKSEIRLNGTNSSGIIVNGETINITESFVQLG